MKLDREAAKKALFIVMALIGGASFLLNGVSYLPKNVTTGVLMLLIGLGALAYSAWTARELYLTTKKEAKTS